MILLEIDNFEGGKFLKLHPYQQVYTVKTEVELHFMHAHQIQPMGFHYTCHSVFIRVRACDNKPLKRHSVPLRIEKCY